MPFNVRASDGYREQVAPGAKPIEVLADDLQTDLFTVDDQGNVIANNFGGSGFGAWVYDFAVDGGVAGTIPLRGPAIPANAVFQDGFLEILSALTDAGATATVALGIEASGDVVVAQVLLAQWDTPGVVPLVAAAEVPVPVAAITTAPAAIKTTAVRTPAIDVANENLTGGKFRFWARWVQSEP